jgi:hypothetical protein
VILTFSHLWSKVCAMNTITVLLGATGLLLVAAVALSFSAMNKRADSSEVAGLRAEIAALEEQQRSLNAPASSLLGSPNPLVPVLPPAPVPAPFPAPVPTPPLAELAVNPEPSGHPTPSPTPVNPVAGDIGENSSTGDAAKMKALQEELARAKKAHETLLAEQEQGLISKHLIGIDRKNQARASTVKAAFLQAKVIEWVPEDVEGGGFAMIEVHRDDLQVGTILGIRRKSGIYGHVEVVHLYPADGQAAANPVRGTFPDGGKPTVKLGDELIIPPL